MKKQTLIQIFIRVTLIALAAIGLPAARAQVVTTDSIAGTRNGNLHFSIDTHVECIQLTIPTRCEPGSVCAVHF